MRLISSLLFVLPFLCCTGGYFIARCVLQRSTVTIPCLIGKTADAALLLLSEKQLNPRIIGLVDEPDLEPGTVINQIPRADALARPHQTIFLVLASRPTTHIARLCIGTTAEHIRKHYNSEHGEPLFVHLPHALPVGTCFAQSPAEDEPLSTKPMYYISSGMHETYIWPSLLNAPAHDALEILKKQGVEITIIGEYANAPAETLKSLRIIDQRPLPGSFVQCDTMHKPSLHVRLAR